MTQTVGYYCPLCKTKYVKHSCQNGLPCNHPKLNSVFVRAKRYGRGGEDVRLIWRKGDVMLSIDHQEGDLEYINDYAKFFKNTDTDVESGVVSIDEWMSRQEGKIKEAYMSRWQSVKLLRVTEV